MNDTLPGGDKNPAVLGCPNFRSAFPATDNHQSLANEATTAGSSAVPETIVETDETGASQMDDNFPLQLLRFFRDLTGAQRLAVLIRLGALPEDWSEPLNHSAERRALDAMRSEGRVNELRKTIDDVIAAPKNGED